MHSMMSLLSIVRTLSNRLGYDASSEYSTTSVCRCSVNNTILLPSSDVAHPAKTPIWSVVLAQYGVLNFPEDLLTFAMQTCQVCAHVYESGWWAAHPASVSA